MADAELQQAVERLAQTHDAYAPLELLLAEGRLRYADYEAWRGGELPFLEEALLGNVQRARDRLREAAACARRLGLQPERLGYTSWGTPGDARQLRFCAGAEAAEALYRTHYQRPAAPGPAQREGSGAKGRPGTVAYGSAWSMPARSRAGADAVRRRAPAAARTGRMPGRDAR